jgi:hypothetical protein
MKKIRVRFNLGQGKNYMKWKIEYPDGRIEYHVPSETQLILDGCILKNFKTVAKTIFDGANKTVCAWVLCDKITIIKECFTQFDDKEQTNRIRYNPRVTPHWMFEGEIADGKRFDLIASVDRGLYNIKL